MSPLYSTHDLAVGYKNGKKNTILLSGLNLTLDAGRFVALLGQNGAGKSTLLKALSCATQPMAGEVMLNGKNVAHISLRNRSRMIGLVSTDAIQAGALTVAELVALGRQPYTGVLGRLDDHDHDIVARAIADVGITAKAHNYVAQLSDGERQKAMIARALAQCTPIIILDEPTAFLDAASRIETMQLLASLARDQHKAILLSTHDISRSLLLTHELWLITRERKVVAGPTATMVHSEVMNEVFNSPGITFNPNHCDYEASE